MRPTGRAGRAYARPARPFCSYSRRRCTRALGKPFEDGKHEPGMSDFYWGVL